MPPRYKVDAQPIARKESDIASHTRRYGTPQIQENEAGRSEPAASMPHILRATSTTPEMADVDLIEISDSKLTVKIREFEFDSAQLHRKHRDDVQPRDLPQIR